MFVHHPCHATHKSHGYKHGAQDQGGGDYGAEYLLHGENGGLRRRELSLAHAALHVLQHHYGVIHHYAYGQHHTEQGEQVDGEAQQQHAGKGADQGHRHSDTGDQGGAEILQEEVNHHEHQHHGFKQGMHYLLNGEFYELGGVIGDLILDILRKPGLQLRHGGVYGIRHGDGVGTRLQIGRYTDGWLAVGASDYVVVFTTQLDPGNVLDPNFGAIWHGSYDDVLELFDILKAPLGLHRVSEVDGRAGGLSPYFARGKLGVLLTNGANHIARGQLQLGKTIRTQPDPHGVVSATKEHGVANARYPLEFVDDVEQGIVRQVGRIK